MKVVFLSATGVLGGAERVLLMVLGALRQAQPETELHLIAAADGPLLERAQALGAHVTLLPLPARLQKAGDSGLHQPGRVRRFLQLAGQALGSGPGVIRYVRRLRRVLRELHPDVVHANGFKMHVLGALAKPRGSKLVWHLHDFCTPRPVMARALRWLAARADAAIAISQAVADDARRLVGRLPLEVIPNAIDLEHFAPGIGDGAALDRLSGLPVTPPGAVRIGLVATYARWKGHEVFLKAAAQLMHEGVAARCYVIGGPIYQTPGSQYTLDELRRLAAELGVAEQVGFIGFQEDTVPIYRSLDIVVHASTQPEPFGLTIAEAMACGRPVVVARAGGAAELFADGAEAVGIMPGDANALTTALRILADSQAARERLGRAARQAALARFAPGRFGSQLGELYARLRGRATESAMKIPGKVLTSELQTVK